MANEMLCIRRRTLHPSAVPYRLFPGEEQCPFLPTVPSQGTLYYHHFLTIMNGLLCDHSAALICNVKMQMHAVLWQKRRSCRCYALTGRRRRVRQQQTLLRTPRSVFIYLPDSLLTSPQRLLGFIVNNWRLHRAKPLGKAKIQVKTSDVTYEMFRESIDEVIAARLGVENPNGATKGYLGVRQSAIKQYFDALPPAKQKEIQEEAHKRSKGSLDIDTKRKYVAGLLQFAVGQIFTANADCETGIGEQDSMTLHTEICASWTYCPLVFSYSKINTARLLLACESSPFSWVLPK